MFKELCLTDRWSRLISLASSILIMLICGAIFAFNIITNPIIQNNQSASLYGSFRADLFLSFLGFFGGLVASIILVFSKSGEEKDQMEKNYVEEATQEIIRMMDRTKNSMERWFEDGSPQRIKAFRVAYSIFFQQLKAGYADITKEENTKMLLSGLGNTLVVIYFIYEDYMNKRTQIIKSKPENWEQIIDDIDERIDSLIEVKGCFHSTYENIEKIAIRHGVPIKNSKDKRFRYLVYAEADMLKLLDKKKK